MNYFNLPGIKSRREHLNISMQEMARELGYKNASTYMKYENGTYSFRAHHVPILSKKLDMSIDNLYFFNQEIAKTEI
ncbi:helix-turn-helix domain-containing protein [Salibacterium lacus]|uniref:Helix-turn-helix domain-containing protein n=1 Tax=Salibacterium lacus TaxID=1898109 RepID=A0ABW5SWY5_9BACI